MKITVVVDNNGQVLGTYRQPPQVPAGYPAFQIGGGPGAAVHELDLPEEWENVASPEELHQRLEEYFAKGPPKRGE